MKRAEWGEPLAEDVAQGPLSGLAALPPQYDFGCAASSRAGGKPSKSRRAGERALRYNRTL